MPRERCQRLWLLLIPVLGSFDAVVALRSGLGSDQFGFREGEKKFGTSTARCCVVVPSPSSPPTWVCMHVEHDTCFLTRVGLGGSGLVVFKTPLGPGMGGVGKCRDTQSDPGVVPTVTVRVRRASCVVTVVHVHSRNHSNKLKGIPLPHPLQ